MKDIKTLVSDIHKVFEEPHEFAEDRLEKFGVTLAKVIAEKINKTDEKPTLRMSNLGTPCDRQLWYKVNKPELAEKLPPEARVKFLFGDILEQLLLFLAEEAGHSVTGAQDTVTLNGVKGHRDAIIDGILVDCKSASSFSYKKFKEHLTYAQDSFGYIDQLQAYLQASKDDPLLLNKEEAGFLVIDKTLGHITLDMHTKSSIDYNTVVDMKKEVVNSKQIPERGFEDEECGYVNPKTKKFVPNGNFELGTNCSYCPFKKQCWPGLRTFLYSAGPSYLTKVVKPPKAQEVETPGP